MRGSRQLHRGTGHQYIILNSPSTTTERLYRLYNRGPGDIDIIFGNTQVPLPAGDSVDILVAESIFADYPAGNIDTSLVEWELLA